MKPLLLEMTAGAIAILMAGGCAARTSVSSHVDRSLDFSQYRTFDWGPPDALPTGDPRLDRDPDFNDHVQGAVERGLAARGLELASGPADLLIHYHAVISDRMDVNRFDRGFGYCGAADCPPEPVRYQAGTLVLDFIDSRTNTLVWRGWAQSSVEDMLRDKARMVTVIDQAVADMLRQLPRMRRVPA